MTTDRLRALSENSPVTMGLAGGLLIAAFFGGHRIGQMETAVAAVVAGQADHAAAIAALHRITAAHDAKLSTLERAAEKFARR